MTQVRRPFVGGNWKMHGDGAQALALAETLASQAGPIAGEAELSVFPPFPYLAAVGCALEGSGIHLGAQDVSAEANGAHTGQVSAEMLLDLGCTHVIVGHSERRHGLGESDELAGAKAAIALASGLTCVLCVGETLAERKAGQAHQVTSRQLRAALKGLDAAALDRLVLAYEPVWAIGTGISATPQDAAEAHGELRKCLGFLYDAGLAARIRIIYGGSCNPGNAQAIFAQPGVDGGLIGGASLKAGDFNQIAERAAEAGRRNLGSSAQQQERN